MPMMMLNMEMIVWKSEAPPGTRGVGSAATLWLRLGSVDAGRSGSPASSRRLHGRRARHASALPHSYALMARQVSGCAGCCRPQRVQLMHGSSCTGCPWLSVRSLRSKRVSTCMQATPG